MKMGAEREGRADDWSRRGLDVLAGSRWNEVLEFGKGTRKFMMGEGYAAMRDPSGKSAGRADRSGKAGIWAEGCHRRPGKEHQRQAVESRSTVVELHSEYSTSTTWIQTRTNYRELLPTGIAPSAAQEQPRRPGAEARRDLSISRNARSPSSRISPLSKPVHVSHALLAHLEIKTSWLLLCGMRCGSCWMCIFVSSPPTLDSLLVTPPHPTV